MTAPPLSIAIHPARQGAARVSIRSTRPVKAARVLENRSPEEALGMLPRLYSVCAMAQLDAGRQALAAAGSGIDLLGEEDRDRERVLLETAREHLWRILIDWPALLESEADPAQVMSLGKLNQWLRSRGEAPGADRAAGTPALQLSELLLTGVFGREPLDWLSMDCEAVQDWSREVDTPAANLVAFLIDQRWEDTGAIEPRFLPNVTNAEFNDRLAEDESDQFVTFPEWEDEACETTPLLRQQNVPMVRQLLDRWGGGGLTRVVALLAELAGIPEQLTVVSSESAQPHQTSLPENTGLSQVNAARGRLVHRAVVDQHRIRRYQVLAPTEWNCHPRGVLAKSLSALDSQNANTVRKQAALLITAIDPCVGYSLEVH